MSQYFATSLPAPQFTPLQTGFTPDETPSLLVPETPVSRSLGASFSELTGMPTPPYLHVLGPSTVAPVTGTTEALPSLVASSEPTIVLPAQSIAAPVPDLTQTTTTPITTIEGHTAQSSGSDDNGAQF